MIQLGSGQERIRFSPTLALRSSVVALDRLTYWAIVIVMLAMTIMVSLQVFYRYALGSSIDSADETARLFFVWATFLAIPHGIRYGVHVGIDLLVLALPTGIREVIFRISAAVSAVLMILVFGFGLVATVDKWPELMPTLPISAGIFYCAVVVSTGHSFLHLLLLTLCGSRAWGDETL
jgi:TRAP-type C4-dicarboxylate transport system permease small subunit